jgi:prephenate dehydratase
VSPRPDSQGRRDQPGDARGDSHADSATPSGRPRAGYLGPEGTFSEEALLASIVADAVEPVGLGTIYDTVMALRRGEVDWAIVPIENSLDGSVTVTLDLLAGEEDDLEIVGDIVLGVTHSLIAAEMVDLGEIDTVLTHPQVPGQCQRFLRTELAHARVLPASSTAEAVRAVVGDRGSVGGERTQAHGGGEALGGERGQAHGGRRRQAAIGTLLAARIYGGTVVREGVQDRNDNETRFVWLGRADGESGRPPLRTGGELGGQDSDGSPPGPDDGPARW